jgi:hypothetical protein
MRAPKGEAIMNIKGMVVMTLALAVSAQAAGKIQVCAADQVVVYVDGGNYMDNITLYRAEHLANQMFARIGVSVKWHQGKPPREDTEAIAVSLVSGLREQFYPDALGYATISPHAAGRVFVLADRLKEEADPRLVPTILAHVLVHEITHVLEGVSRHSETGLMKANWTGKDYAAMAHKPLEFAPVDVNIIHYRLAHR